MNVSAQSYGTLSFACRSLGIALAYGCFPFAALLVVVILARDSGRRVSVEFTWTPPSLSAVVLMVFLQALTPKVVAPAHSEAVLW